MTWMAYLMACYAQPKILVHKQYVIIIYVF